MLANVVSLVPTQCNRNNMFEVDHARSSEVEPAAQSAPAIFAELKSWGFPGNYTTKRIMEKRIADV